MKLNVGLHLILKYYLNKKKHIIMTGLNFEIIETKKKKKLWNYWNKSIKIKYNNYYRIQNKKNIKKKKEKKRGKKQLFKGGAHFRHYNSGLCGQLEML